MSGYVLISTCFEFAAYQVSDRPLGWFSKLDCSTTEMVVIPNDTSSESCRRDVSNSDLFVAISNVETSTIENRPRGL